MKKLILFDFDGVLVRSNHCHIKNIRDTFSELGLPLNADEVKIKSYFGKHYEDVIHNLMMPEHRTVDNIDAVCKRLSERLLEEDFVRGFERIDGISDFLMDLKNKGFNLGIASGNRHDVLEKWVEFFGLSDYFSFLIGSDDVSSGKPAPDMIHLASQMLDVTLDNLVYVGDALYDVMMAKNAGVRSFVVLSGALNHDDALSLGPDFIAEDVTKIGNGLDL